MQPKYQVQLKIRRSAAAVFEAVVRPEKLSSYFVQSASAPLTEGTTVKWKFAEVPGEHDVTVRRVVKDQCVVLEWAGTQSGQKIRVEMMFQALDADTTMVQI